MSQGGGEFEVGEARAGESVGPIKYLLSPVRDPWSVFRGGLSRPRLRLFLMAALAVSALGGAGGALIASRVEYRFVNPPEGVSAEQIQSALRVFSGPAFVGVTTVVSGVVVAFIAGGLVHVAARLAGGDPVSPSSTLTGFGVVYLTEGVRSLLSVIATALTIPQRVVITIDLSNPYSSQVGEVTSLVERSPVMLSLSGLVAAWQWFLLTELLRTMFGLSRGRSASLAAALVLLKFAPTALGLAL